MRGQIHLAVIGLAVARVSDVVTYEDGSEAVIIDGAGASLICNDKPVALVGSRLSNGDCIAETLQRAFGIFVSEHEPIEGLFDPTYVPPPVPPRYRLAVQGATTARGGVLSHATGNWNTGISLGKAGVVGDLIHYPDGSTARIISGLSFNQPHVELLAFVGSQLDNGDTITDSPEREGQACSDSFTVIQRLPTTTEEAAA